MTRVLLLGVLLVGAMLTACSSDDGDGSSGGGTQGDGVAADADLAKQGRTLTAGQCWACHSQDGSVSVGPTWLGLYGSTVTLDDGSTVEADEAYIRESVLTPSAKVVEGFADGTMPTFTTFSDADIDAIVEYIKSLGE